MARWSGPQRERPCGTEEAGRSSWGKHRHNPLSRAGVIYIYLAASNIYTYTICALANARPSFLFRAIDAELPQTKTVVA